MVRTWGFVGIAVLIGLAGQPYAAAESAPPRSGGGQAENNFQAVSQSPLSTFSVDVGTSSYATARSYLLQKHAMPPVDAVRIEELINYFDYDYPEPTDGRPLGVHLETAECPWQPKHRLVRCALQAQKVRDNRPTSNLVFLIDVSGSMSDADKLPLLQRSLTLLVEQLRPRDKISIVVYGGAAGMVLRPTSGVQKGDILQAINGLKASGMTNSGDAIQLAYQTAAESLVNGVNRVILCSDGDFNVGVSSADELVRLAKERAKRGIYLSVLGFGAGNYDHALLDALADKANGYYTFIDSEAEARKVFVEQLEGKPVTVAKDVKINVEFNPAQVAAYRLIGYENAPRADVEFRDERKPAGEVGMGHRVTVLFELIPVGVDSAFTNSFQRPANVELSEAALSGELLTLALRYKLPNADESTKVTFPLKDSGHSFAAASKEFQFAAAVASFGMLIRDSKFQGNTSFIAVLATAHNAHGNGSDPLGIRGEFGRMCGTAADLTRKNSPPPNSAWFPPSPPERFCGTPDPPRYYSRTPPAVIFATGISIGVGLAVVATLLGLGLFSLRTMLLANWLPPAKLKAGT